MRTHPCPVSVFQKKLIGWNHGLGLAWCLPCTLNATLAGAVGAVFLGAPPGSRGHGGGLSPWNCGTHKALPP